MTDDHKAIEEANAGFYRAFEALVQSARSTRSTPPAGARRR